jgi:Heterokaryon incompatibility protein (HET)
MCVTSLSGINQFNPEQCVLPTRCVEVIGDRVRLRETAGLVGSYIILSHRWDDDTKLCRTTMENYETRKDEIPLQWLSLTFQDAIAVTKRLGIRYIWIDSICIIQEGDGGRDWRAEASKMAQYYQQSLLTITGTCSSQYLGLCPSREEKPRLFLRLPYRNRAGVHVGSFYMYESVNLTGNYYENFVMGSELMGRGWIFQERLLSRRLVCFTPKGTFMECQTAMPQNECGELVTGNAPGNRLSFSNPTFCDVFRAGDFQVWYNMVKEYSTLRLTQNTDRPEAILGVASEFREVLHKCFKTEEISYGGGLWEKDLWRGLCWMTAEDPPEGGFQRLGKATWSWTSLLARVDWPSIESAQCACQSHRFVSSSPATSDDTDGQLAYIAMSARLQPVIFAGLFKKKTMYKLLGYDSPPETNPPFFSKSLRVICSPAKPKVVAGWASIEHEEFQTLASLRRPNVEHPLAALHVSTMHRLPGGFHLGYLVPWHSAFVVLFVQHMSDKQYRRVGAGILFGPEIERGFTKGKFQDIELI